MISSWNSFFFQRTGIQGCRVAGYMRSSFALMFLIDRIIMLFHLDFFFSPDHGVLPYRVSSKNYQLVDYKQKSLFGLFPESNEFVWIMAGIGIMHGIVLFLGATKYLRFHLFGLFVNMMSFYNHNSLMWDGEDDMFRLWCFLLLFFPLDHCTIYDKFGFGSSSSSSPSWPMWPFRLFQIETVIIYIGASFGKLNGTSWQDGSAIYRLTYGHSDYPGIYNPDFMFGRYGPLKILTWSALLLESTCYITVWVPSLRNLSIVLMIFLHIGIDLSMNLHMFEWLSCIGWIAFLIQPVLPAESKSAEKTKTRKASVTSFWKKALTNIFIASFVFVISFDSIPFADLKLIVPAPLKPAWSSFAEKRKEIWEQKIDFYISPIGISQGGDWGMYTDVEVVLEVYRIDAVLKNSTKVKNIWRSPEWSDFPDWKRKLVTRRINYYGEVTTNRDELLHLMELVTNPFLEQGNVVDTLSFVTEYRTHKTHKMESSTGGFWGPVVKHPMNIRHETDVLVVQLGDCQNSLSAATCEKLIGERGCTSILDECRRSCSEECGSRNFVVKYWADLDGIEEDDDSYEDDDEEEYYDDGEEEYFEDDDDEGISQSEEL